MFKKIKKEIKQTELETSYIKKSQQAKLGGKGLAGVYRDKKTGKDYLFKRALTPGHTPAYQKMVHWRSWDEILTAHFLKHAGVLVPEMFAVQDAAGWVYVASSMIPGVKICTKDAFQNLPKESKEQVYVSLMMHCWLGNRDIVNFEGENFIVDSNNRVFHVDLSATLYSGFRSIVAGQDDVNFNDTTIQPFLLDSQNPDFGIMSTREGKKIASRNIKSTQSFFEEFLANPELERQCHLQGALKIAQFGAQDIEDLVNSTAHTQEDKQIRIKVLTARKAEIIHYVEKKYGKRALKEEQMALELQRVFHKQGIYNPFEKTGGTDAKVSFKALYSNALKPRVIINQDNTVTIQSPRVVEILPIIQRLAGSKIVIGNQVKVTMPCDEFRKALHKELIENILQIVFSSFAYKAEETGEFYQKVYKGDGHDGFRPQLSTDANAISFTVPSGCDGQQIKQQIYEAFHITQDKIKVENDILSLSETTLEEFAAYLMENAGVRKTAVVSENKEGNILAGKLNLKKKGVSGFATAGGNSDYPYNPVRAAREEGTDEFGYSIHADSTLIPMASTLANKKKNIFLVTSGGTSEHHDRPIGYPEFQEGSVRYYSFSDFREDYKHYKVTFDRSSVDVYLRHYQCEIQKRLYLLGIENMLVHISKKPQSLGKIFLKPAIDNLGKPIPVNKKCIQLMDELFGKEKYALIRKGSQQSRAGKGISGVVSRECIELNEALNPAQFCSILSQKVQDKSSLVVYLPHKVSAPKDPFKALSAHFTTKTKKYLIDDLFNLRLPQECYELIELISRYQCTPYAR